MKKLILLILLIGFTVQGQITIGVYADAKLLFIGDDKGNDAGTLDLVVIPKLRNGKGVFVYPYFEYADLQGGEYLRYGIGGGYSFELRNLNIEPSLDYGRILRWDKAYSSFNGILEVNYKITPRIRLSVLASLTQRNDIKYKWEDATWRYNLYGGLTYQLGKIDRSIRHFNGR